MGSDQNKPGNYGSDCQRIILVTNWLISLGLVLNSSSFLLRALAVFADSKLIKALLSLLWLTTLTALTIPFSATADSDTQRHVCVVTVLRPFAAAGFFTAVLYDTVVFVAISHQVIHASLFDPHSHKLSTRMCGRGLGTVSRALLQSGEYYYL